MKIYVDSRFRTADSRSASDFTIELLESIDFRGGRLHVRDITVPVTWRTVEELNRNLYIRERWAAGTRHRVLSLPLGQYDPRTLESALAAAFNSADGLFSQAGAPYLVSYSDQTGAITVRLSVQSAYMKIFTDQELSQFSSSNWPFPSGQPNQPMSFNRNLRHQVPSETTDQVPFQSEFVDMFSIKDLYLFSSTLGGADTLGPMPGSKDCLAKLGVSVSYGYVAHGNETSAWEFINVGPRILKRMSFQLRDVSGAIVPLHGCDWSFCLNFDSDV